MDAYGDVEVTQNQIAEVGNVYINSATGNIKLDDVKIYAGKDVMVTADTGSIIGTADMKANTVTDDNYNGRIYVWGNKEVKIDGNSKLDGYDVIVGSKIGNVTLNEVIADVDGGMAAVGTARESSDGGNANVEIGTIQGNRVIIYTKADNDKTKVEKLLAGDRIVMLSDDITVNEASNVKSSTDKLNVDIAGAAGRQMTKKLQANFTDAQGVDYNTFWVENGAMTVNGPISINNYAVGGNVRLTSLGAVTSIYGLETAPLHDDADNYYISAAQGKTIENMMTPERLFDGKLIEEAKGDAFGKTVATPETEATLAYKAANEITAAADQAETMRNNRQTADTISWYNIYQKRYDLQRTNGILLQNKNYFYADNQRYSVNNLGGIVDNQLNQRDIKRLNPVYPITFTRYGLSLIAPLENLYSNGKKADNAKKNQIKIL